MFATSVSRFPICVAVFRNSAFFQFSANCTVKQCIWPVSQACFWLAFRASVLRRAVSQLAQARSTVTDHASRAACGQTSKIFRSSCSGLLKQGFWYSLLPALASRPQLKHSALANSLIHVQPNTSLKRTLCGGPSLGFKSLAQTRPTAKCRFALR